MEKLTSLTIFQVADLRDKLLAEISTEKKTVIDLGELHDFDVAGLQLLVSCIRTAKDTGKEIEFGNVSESLCQSAASVGIDFRIFSMS